MTLNPKQFNPGDNPDQLQLLMKPSEILKKLNSFGDAPNEFAEPDSIDAKSYKKPRLHRVKYKESKKSGLADDIKKSGVVKAPVWLRTTTDEETSINPSLSRQFVLSDGHHRFATAFEMEQSGNKDIHLPVRHLYMKPDKTFPDINPFLG